MSTISPTLVGPWKSRPASRHRGRQEPTSDPSAQFVHSSSHSLRLSILGVYVSVAPPGWSRAGRPRRSAGPQSHAMTTRPSTTVRRLRTLSIAQPVSRCVPPHRVRMAPSFPYAPSIRPSPGGICTELDASDKVMERGVAPDSAAIAAVPKNSGFHC